MPFVQFEKIRAISVKRKVLKMLQDFSIFCTRLTNLVIGSSDRYKFYSVSDRILDVAIPIKIVQASWILDFKTRC